MFLGSLELFGFELTKIPETQSASSDSEGLAAVSFYFINRSINKDAVYTLKRTSILHLEGVFVCLLR